MLGDNFLSDLSLPTLPCLVGDMRAKSSDLPSSISQVQRLDLHPNAPLMMGLSPDSTVEQIRVISAVNNSGTLHMCMWFALLRVHTCMYMQACDMKQ